MDTYIVSLFGHRQLDNPQKARANLKKVVQKLVSENGHVEFLVGENGEFIQLVISMLQKKKRKREFANASLCLVLPYPTEEYIRDRKGLERIFDEIEIYGSNDYKSVSWDRNISMIDRSNLVVCCVERKLGDSFEALNYARGTGKKTVNVARSLLFTAGF